MKTDGDCFCPVEDLRRFIQRCFRRIGLNNTDADFIADSIIASELAGHACHGVRRLPEYLMRWRSGFADPAARMKIERDLGAVVVADGRRAFGHLFLRDATDLAVDRAKQHGVALFSGKGSESAGRLADYCERAADAGVITLFFVNDSGGAQVVAPPGGLQPRMSTNPVAFGVPRSKPPHLVLDMATSTVANGRLSETKDRGEPVPEGWINPAGVLKHFGGVKGFGLAVIAEALAGALSGGGTVRADPSTEDQAFVLIAIDVRQIRALEDFTSDVEAFIAYIKDVELLPDAAPVRMPGEAKLQGVEAIRITGITVQPAILGRLREAVSSLGIELPASLAS